MKKRIWNRLAFVFLIGALLGLSFGAPVMAQEAVTIQLTAQNISFDKDEITVPAGAEVTVEFTNMDQGTPHNFSVYTDASAQTPIFIGDIITGGSITYTFTAPDQPGTYYFRCDPHAPIMNGDFIVTGGGTPTPTTTPPATTTPPSTPTPTPSPTPTPMPPSQAMEFALVPGWYQGMEIYYYDFGANTPLAGDAPLTAPIWVFIHGMENGTPQFVTGQHNIVGAVPGEEGYSDLWQVNLVTVPADYEADSIRSADDVMSSGYTVNATDIYVNCPIVPEGSTLETGMPLTQGWHNGEAIYYFDFGENPPIAAPIYVPATGMDDQGNPVTVSGQRNIIDVIPGDEGYSDFWRVNLVIVTEDYEANALTTAADVLASEYEIVEADVLVNCPVFNIAPPEVAFYQDGWPLPNHDYSNTRATMDSDIDATNVDELSIAWSAIVPAATIFGAIATTPIIMGDTVYYQDLENNIYAVDLNDGSLIWQKMYNIPNIGPNGIAVGWGKVFGSASPFEIVALDADTGEEAWRTELPLQPNEGVDIQPQLYHNMVLVSSVPGNNVGNFYSGGAVGTIFALDQETGNVAWSFRTVDSEDIWGNPEVNSGGGSWYPPAVDIETGIIYWSVANPAPWPGTEEFPNGTSRPGPNLYTNSLIALDEDGNLLWYNQVLPHDILDHDLQSSPILAAATVNGTMQDIVITAGKMGRVYAMNRETGELLWEVEVGEHLDNRLTEYPTDNATRVLPGAFGGVETPMAYADGILYVPLLNLYMELTGDGATLDVQPFDEGTGELIAIDVSDGNIMWTKEFDSVNFGGATVVNDLVFTATFDGMIYGFDRETGEELFTYQAPGGINGWPAVAGDTIVWPVGQSATPSVIALRPGEPQPIVNIVMPTDNMTLQSGDITVLAQVLNFDLVANMGEPAAEGEGHIHFYLDVEVPTTPGEPAVTDEGTFHVTENATFTWEDIGPGEHTFAVQLVNNDHTPLDPPVFAEVTVIVSDTWVEIISPSPDFLQTITENSVTVEVEVSGFTPGEEGDGQIVYYLDAAPPTAAGESALTEEGTYIISDQTSAIWEDLDEGMHIFYVQLVNSDMEPLDIPITARVIVIISRLGQQTGP